MSDCSPLRLVDNGHSSPSQSSGSRGSGVFQRIDSNSSRSRRNTDRIINFSQNSRQEANHCDGSTALPRTSSVDSSRSGQLRYGARNVIELFIPVSLCMLIVVGTMKATDSYRYSSQTVIWYAQVMFTDQTVDTGTRIWQSFANAFIMLIFIAVMTTILILLYKFRFYATIHGWLILSSLILLFMFAMMYIAEILKFYNIPMDIYTLMIFIWNFGVVGMICIHWKGPLLLQQGYLIMISALLALIFIRSLPDWTTWTVLGVVSIWDLIAVLCPRGPLRILVETAQERNESIFPALIYSSTMIWEFATIMAPHASVSMSDQRLKHTDRANRNRKTTDRLAENDSSYSNADQVNRRPRPRNTTSVTKRSRHPVEIQYDDGVQAPDIDIIQPSFSRPQESDVVEPSAQSNTRRNLQDTHSSEQVQAPSAISNSIQINNQQLREHSTTFHQVEEERGVKLGLGDFIFYSLLVGKASSYGDWIITLSCYVAIMVGLCVTLALLALFRKALPALPISIAFALSSFFLSYLFAVPFAEILAVDQVFI